MDFRDLVIHNRRKKDLPTVGEDQITLSFDPGHTTGWSVFHGLELFDCGEIDTTSIKNATSTVGDIMYCEPDVVIIEEYRVYKWRAKHHAGSDLLTARVIGCIETICNQNMIEFLHKQPASVAKIFCTDARLREWGFHQPGLKHARDAIRHATYYLIFGPPKYKPGRGAVG